MKIHEAHTHVFQPRALMQLIMLAECAYRPEAKEMSESHSDSE